VQRILDEQPTQYSNFQIPFLQIGEGDFEKLKGSSRKMIGVVFGFKGLYRHLLKS